MPSTNVGAQSPFNLPAPKLWTKLLGENLKVTEKFCCETEFKFQELFLYSKHRERTKRFLLI